MRRLGTISFFLALASPALASPAKDQLDWVVAGLDAKSPPAIADVRAHLDDAFLAKVPPTTVQAVFAQYGAKGPWTFVRVEKETPDALVGIVHSDPAGFWRIRLALDADQKMTALLLQPAPDLEAGPTSWKQVDDQVSAVAPLAGFLAADITDGKCTVVHALHADQERALGSAFKLYVLDAIARDVAAGKRTWKDPVTIEDAKKSLPSGDLQTQPAGTKLSLEDVAAKMISISDNTAADHLLYVAGRDAVEAAVARAGGANIALDAPFLTTREMFAIKLLLSPDEQQAWLGADAAKRRAMLAGIDARDLTKALLPAMIWKKPVFVDKVEWFASPDDLCKLGLELKADLKDPEVAHVLSINPGTIDPRGLWKFIGYKGGSEPGVLTMTWLLQRASDGHWFFVTVDWNDLDRPISEDVAIRTAGVVRDAVATLP